MTASGNESFVQFVPAAPSVVLGAVKADGSCCGALMTTVTGIASIIEDYPAKSGVLLKKSSIRGQSILYFCQAIDL